MAKRTASTTIYFDGLCEPNPGGIATYGYVISRGGKTLEEGGGAVTGEETTNNIAEYTGLVRALERAVALGLTVGAVKVFGDSKLVISQVTGEWRVRDRKLAPLYLAARALVEKFERPTLSWVPREQNKEADRLSYEAYVRVLASR